MVALMQSHIVPTRPKSQPKSNPEWRKVPHSVGLFTNKGQIVRTRVKEIRETGRNTMGVKLMDLHNGEKLQAIAPVVSQGARRSTNRRGARGKIIENH
jgi:DNA gyrase/topoisomerase IV subunit A